MAQPATDGSETPCTSSSSSAAAAASGLGDWQAEVLGGAVGPGQLVRLTLRGRIGEGMPYRQAVAVPIMLRGKPHLKVSCFTERQDLTSNYAPEEAGRQLQALLQLPWRSASLQTLQQSLQVQVTKKGKALVQRQQAGGPPAAGGGGGLISAEPTAPRAHDREKELPLPPGRPDAFLQRIGLQTQDGRVPAAMQAKLTQVNELLKLLIHTGRLEQLLAQAPESAGARAAASPLHIVDCGCGAAHLTLGTYHYIHNVLGCSEAMLTGVDSNAHLMQRSNTYCRELGLEAAASFHTAAIRDFTPRPPPDIVLALHACDTATDEALALGVRHGASIILAAPCCHKDLQRQLAAHKGGGPHQFGPLLRHGILQQRQLDLVTDALRAQLLRICGYRTDVVEFVATEHTPRNLAIRAVKLAAHEAPSGGSLRRLWAEYHALAEFWGVTLRLQTLLEDWLQQRE